MKLRYFLLSLCLCVFVIHLPKAAAQIEKARWIGAISKQEAKIPTGRWSNAVFKKDSFKLKWQDVDSLSARSIIVKKDFKAKGKIAKAVVDVCGLGHYELTINGQKVGDSEFAPLWSEYDKTVYYNRYDVTDYLRKGINRMETLLGNGMFNVQRGSRYSKLQQSFGPPQLLLRLLITYRNGKQQIVESDGSWQWCLSPITFNSIYGGESYEAPLESPLGGKVWQPVVFTEGPKGTLRLQTAPPVKIMERYDVKSWNYILPDSIEAASKATKRTIQKGAFVCDMGQNLAGFPEITVSGKTGQKITLLVSEKLTPQGACDQRQTGRQHYYEYTIGNHQHPSPITQDFPITASDIYKWKERYLKVSPIPTDCPCCINCKAVLYITRHRKCQVSSVRMNYSPKPIGSSSVQNAQTCRPFSPTVPIVRNLVGWNKTI